MYIVHPPSLPLVCLATKRSSLTESDTGAFVIRDTSKSNCALFYVLLSLIHTYMVKHTPKSDRYTTFMIIYIVMCVACRPMAHASDGALI